MFSNFRITIQQSTRNAIQRIHQEIHEKLLQLSNSFMYRNQNKKKESNLHETPQDARLQRLKTSVHPTHSRLDFEVHETLSRFISIIYMPLETFAEPYTMYQRK